MRRGESRYRQERLLLDRFCAERGLHYSAKREQVLDAFLDSEHHISSEKLLDELQRRGAQLDIKTVQASMELLVGAGLARELRLEDGSLVYEHAFGHSHHDHLICRRCGRMIEFANREIERVQDQVASQHGFAVEDHALSIYGVCSECAARARLARGAAKQPPAGEDLVPLAGLRPGQRGMVREIRGGEGMQRRMAAMNIRPGKLVTKVSAMLMGGPVVVSIDGRQLAIGHGMAQKIMVGSPWA